MIERKILSDIVEFSSKSTVDLVDFMGGDDRTAMSAWVSFANDDEERLEDRDKVNGLINFLYKNSHLTPFESSVFTFRVETPIFVAREFFRHRSASYNEMSGRYTVMPNKVYMPADDRPLKQVGKPGKYSFVEGTYAQAREAQGSIARTAQHCFEAYNKMLDAGIAKEVARMVLPVNIFTQFYVTMNARNLMHFIELRTDPTALHEIRDVAFQMERHLRSKMPMTYKAFAEKAERPEEPSYAVAVSNINRLATEVRWDKRETERSLTPSPIGTNQRLINDGSIKVSEFFHTDPVPLESLPNEIENIRQDVRDIKAILSGMSGAKGVIR